MGEDRIERAHQDRARNVERLIRLRSKDKLMKSQAKFQGLKHISGLVPIQNSVAKGRKRPIPEGKEMLSVECAKLKQAKRIETRTKVLDDHAAMANAGEYNENLVKARSKLQAITKEKARRTARNTEGYTEGNTGYIGSSLDS